MGIKEIFKSIAEVIGGVWSYLYPPQLSVAAHAFSSHAYTAYLRRHFHHIGKGTAIAYPLAGLKGSRHISLGQNTDIARGLMLTAFELPGSKKPGKITIGNHCTIGANSHITAIAGITIGDNLLTGSNVLITDNAHGSSDAAMLDIPPNDRPLVSKGEVIIGNNVWLGKNVCVLPGVTIGDGVIVGANSVVTRSLPPHVVAAGIPARPIKKIN